MFNCFHPWTVPILLAIIFIGLGILLFLIMRSRLSREKSERKKSVPYSAWIVLATAASMVAIVLWTGSYAFSPLGFARQSSLQAFEVHLRGGRSLRIQPGGGFSMSIGSLAYIAVISTPSARSCYWKSSSGGSMDTNDTCDIVYAPPSTELDVLRVSIQPSCGAPNAAGQIKIAIFP